jgi:type I restriction enzyme S subunit
MLKFRWETEFKETEIGEIPKEWETKKIRDFYNLKYGITLSSSDYGNCRLLRQTDLKDGSVDISSIPYAECEINKISKYSLRGGDLVISRIANVGSIGYIDSNVFNAIDKPLVFGSYLLKFDKKREISNKFTFYFLSSPQMQDYINSIAEGSTRQNTNAKVVGEFPLYYPPLSEQSRIATVLSWFDDLIENKKRQNEILEKTAMAIFKSWFVDFEPFRACPEQERGNYEFVYNEELGKEIPKGWAVKKVIDLCDIVSGRGKYLIEASEGIYPLWGANGVLGYIENYDLEGFSIITGRVGTLGNVFLVEGKFAISDNVLCLAPNKKIWIFLLYLWIKSQVDFESLNVGTSQPLITKTALGNQPLIFPPSPILQSFHSLVEPLFQKIILNQKQIMTLRKIRDTLLPLLVFGKLRIEEV